MGNITDYSKEKSINMLDRGSYGDFGNNTPARQILYTSKDFFFDVAAGLITGHKSITKYGRIPSIGNASSDVTAFGNITYLQVARILDVVSSSAQDTAVGDGARTLIIFGLDGAYNEIEEIVVLNGLTPVQTINSFLRVNRAFVLSVGSTEYNQGNITITDSVGASTQALIIALKGSTEQCAFTVPAAKTCYISSIRGSIYSSGGTGLKQGLFELFTRKPLGAWIQEASEGADSSGGASWFDPASPLPMQEKTDVRIHFTSFQNNAAATNIMQYILKDN